MKDDSKTKKQLIGELKELRTKLSTMDVLTTGEAHSSDQLEFERKRLFKLLELFPGFVYLQALDYTIRYANRYFKKHFGDPKGRLCHEVLWGRKGPCEVCPTFRVFANKRPQKWEWSKTPDGRTYMIYDYPFMDDDSSRLVLEIGVDITERKRAEEELDAKAMELDRMNKDLHNLAMEMTILVEKERKRYAGLLHDDIGQNLVATKLALASFANLCGQCTDDARETIRDIDSLLENTINRVRAMVSDLHPAHPYGEELVDVSVCPHTETVSPCANEGEIWVSG